MATPSPVTQPSDPKQLVAELLHELDENEREKVLEDARREGWLPGFVSAGKNRALYFSKGAERLVHRLSAVLKQQVPSRVRAYTDAEWHQMVRAALGPAVAWVEDNGPTSNTSAEVLRIVLDALQARGPSGSTEVTFGATFLESTNVDRVEVGPVSIEHREAWLQRKVLEGNLTALSASRIKRKWSGKPVANRKPSIHRMNETDVLESVGNSDFVCSVETTGLASGAARSRGVTAAHLAMTTVSLMWERPSRTLDGMRLLVDGNIRHQLILRCTPGKLAFADRSLIGMPFGPHITEKEWRRQRKVYESGWGTVGRTLLYFMDPVVEVTKPTVTTAILHALLWFYQGCKQELDFLAVTHFVSSLDALANGQDSSGIRRLLRARLSYTDATPVFQDGVPMRKLVEDIYSLGRSRTVHGNNLNLRSDWSIVREQCEKLARLTLLVCIAWATQNSLDVSPVELQAT